MTGLTVLIVEGDGDLRARLLELLGGHGLRVTAVSDPEQAWRLVDGGARPDAIFLDCTLGPAGTGTLLHRVRRDQRLRGVPVIALSGSPALLDMVRPWADSALLKPFDAPTLMQALDAATRAPRAEGGSAAGG